MKNTLLALALFAFAGTTAFAQTSPGKAVAKAKKETCKKGEMGGAACCMKKDGKTAAVKADAKAPATASAKM